MNSSADPSDPGKMTLREAVATAVDGDHIIFDGALAGTTVDLTNGQLGITQNVEIDASALEGGIVIRATAASRIFTVTVNATVTLRNLTIENAGTPTGSNRNGGAIFTSASTLTLEDCKLRDNFTGASGNGAGIYSSGSNLTLTRCTVSNNQTGAGAAGNPGGSGGGIYSVNGSLVITECTFEGNGTGVGGTGAAGGSGGALFNSGTSLVIENSTIAANTAAADGAGIFLNTGTLELSSCTVGKNSAQGQGGGIHNASGTLLLANSIVADNVAIGGGEDILGPHTAEETILVEVASEAAGGTGTVLTADPMFGILGDHGGPTWTLPLLAGSPAQDVATGTPPATDQRGFLRYPDPGIDLGAYEADTFTVVVTTLLDENDGSGVNGVSLREALADAPFEPFNVVFDSTITGTANPTIALQHGQLEIDRDVTIDASSIPEGLTIDANQASRILFVNGSEVGLKNLILTGGRALNPSDPNGGAIHNAGGSLTLQFCQVTGNMAGDGAGVHGGQGGGIYSAGGTVLIEDSGIDGNLTAPPLSSGAESRGGGIYFSGAGSLVLTRCSVLENSTASAASGGGMFINGATSTCVNTTIAGNQCGEGGNGGGVFKNSGDLTLNNCTVANNLAGIAGAGSAGRGGGHL